MITLVCLFYIEELLVCGDLRPTFIITNLFLGVEISFINTAIHSTMTLFTSPDVRESIVRVKLALLSNHISGQNVGA